MLHLWILFKRIRSLGVRNVASTNFDVILGLTAASQTARVCVQNVTKVGHQEMKRKKKAARIQRQLPDIMRCFVLFILYSEICAKLNSDTLPHGENSRMMCYKQSMSSYTLEKSA